MHQFLVNYIFQLIGCTWALGFDMIASSKMSGLKNNQQEIRLPAGTDGRAVAAALCRSEPMIVLAAIHSLLVNNIGTSLVDFIKRWYLSGQAGSYRHDPMGIRSPIHPPNLNFLG
jgi:hypothetical protein